MQFVLGLSDFGILFFFVSGFHFFSFFLGLSLRPRSAGAR
jgi:hypothetical protein